MKIHNFIIGWVALNFAVGALAGTKFAVVLSEADQKKLGRADPGVRGEFTTEYVEVSAIELKLIKELTGDENISRGSRTVVDLPGIEDTELRKIVLKALISYGVSESVTLYFEGNSAYKINTADLSILTPTRKTSGAIIEINQKSSPKKYVFLPSEADREKLGTKSANHVIRGTYETEVKALKPEQIEHAKKILQNDKIDGGWMATFNLTGISKPIEKEMVVNALSEYASGKPPIKDPAQIVLNANGNYLFRMMGDDFSMLSKSTVQSAPW